MVKTNKLDLKTSFFLPNLVLTHLHFYSKLMSH